MSRLPGIVMGISGTDKHSALEIGTHRLHFKCQSYANDNQTPTDISHRSTGQQLLN